MPRGLSATLWILAIVAVAWISVDASGRVPALAANGLLHPARRPVQHVIPDNCAAQEFLGAGVMLRGWQCRPSESSRGTIVYLHGVADNRGSATNVIRRYTAKGFDVIAYDSRAHGESDGDVCTYGYFEKDDLRRIIDGVEHRPIILLGTSLGAAVAIQAAARDSRIAGVVAAETFSDLRTVATERAPWILTGGMIARAFQLAEKSGQFEVDAVSPAQAAAAVRVPVLLIHGTDDRETPPTHSQRVMSTLTGPKKLILVDGAGHNESLRQESVWVDIDRWIEQIAASPS